MMLHTLSRVINAPLVINLHFVTSAENEGNRFLA